MRTPSIVLARCRTRHNLELENVSDRLGSTWPKTDAECADCVENRGAYSGTFTPLFGGSITPGFASSLRNNSHLAGTLLSLKASTASELARSSRATYRPSSGTC
jgi:hypothetical protein